MASELTPASASAIVDLTGLPEPAVKSIAACEIASRGDRKSGPLSSMLPQLASLRGRFADLGLSIPKEDIDLAQREAWRRSPWSK